MPRQFYESDLQFSFPRGWWVRAFDDHRYYQALSGSGLKAVDFAVLPPAGPLRLIEVKNYYARSDASGRPYPVTLPRVEDLVEQVQEKYADSQRIIQIVDRYYQRKWYFRQRLKLTTYLPRLWRFGDLPFYDEAARRMETLEPIPVLYLAVPDHFLDFRRSVTERLAKASPSWEISYQV